MALVLAVGGVVVARVVVVGRVVVALMLVVRFVRTSCCHMFVDLSPVARPRNSRHSQTSIGPLPAYAGRGPNHRRRLP